MLEAIEFKEENYDGHFPLDRLSLQIEPGEVLCLLGGRQQCRADGDHQALSELHPAHLRRRVSTAST
jgi:hypothetical protein